MSTTRQWNPGDEFIMQGITNILETAYGKKFNVIIFNRNPDVRTGGARLKNRVKNMTAATYKWGQYQSFGKGFISEFFNVGHYDNSCKDDMNPDNIDFAIFAGSPEWYSNRLLPMYKMIEKAAIPTIYLGIGAGDSMPFSEVGALVKRVLSRAKLITARDLSTVRLLESIDAIYVPCPALLAAPKNRIVRNVGKIGLIFTTEKTLKGQRVSKEMSNYSKILYHALIKKYRVGLVCHYIDEIDEARKEFPDVDIYYSYDSKDYIDIYNAFDLVIGGRVHGIGLSASLGIPGIIIKHDTRGSTAEGFLAETIEVGHDILDVEHKVEEMVQNITVYSEKLLIHKQVVMDKYVELIRSTGIVENMNNDVE